MRACLILYIYKVMATIFSRIIAGEIPCYKDMIFSNLKLKLTDEEFKAVAEAIRMAL